MITRYPSKRRAVQACIVCLAATSGLLCAAGDAEPSRAWLGVWLGTAVDGGAQVVALEPDGPAEQGGVRAGDVLVEANGLPLPGPDRLDQLLSGLAPGDRVRFSVLRSGQLLPIPVILGQRPPVAERVAVSPPPRIPRNARSARLRLESMLRARPAGVLVQEITPDLRQHFGAPPDTGVLVVRIDSGWLGDAVDVQVGDVLIRLADREIRERQELERMLRTWNWDRPLEAQLIRGGQPRVVEWVRPEASPETESSKEPDGTGLLERSLRLEIERLERRIEALRAELEDIQEKP